MQYSDEDVSVVTGLPVNSYKAHSKEIGQHTGKHTVTINKHTVCFNLAQIKKSRVGLSLPFYTLNLPIEKYF